MRYLIDTHVLIWYLEGNEQLSKKVREELDNEENVIIISIVSLWELTIKTAKHKEKIGFKITLSEIESYIFERDFMLLNITFNHLHVLERLVSPKDHSDPFDRLIIAQAKSEDLIVLSVDRRFAAYPINVIW